MIEFRTLGALDLRDADGNQLHSLLAQPKRIGLLAYLAAAGHAFHRRDTLIGLFWPESDETHARASLRNSLHVLRQSLGENALISRGDEEIGINEASWSCDVNLFKQKLAAGEPDEALNMYRGDFLAGFFLHDLPSVERWIESERSILRNAAARAARSAAKKKENDRNLTEAIVLARRAVELTESDERAVRGLLELLIRAGDRSGALEVYGAFRLHLEQEYGSLPSDETQVLVAALSTRADALKSHRGPARPPEAYSSQQEIQGYQFEGELGGGSTSTVYLAHDLKHDRDVAIKVLRADVASMLGTARFLSEISVVAKLHHPNILPLLDSGEASGLPYYVMPRVDGETLRSMLDRERFLSVDAAIAIALEVADALDYAHQHGIIHRDIKPENILFSGGHALLSDFGIAKAISVATDRRLTQPGVAMGTAAYMSPEQADPTSHLDVRTDVYSLACVVYEMLTGDPPFVGSSAQVILARKVAEPAPRLRTVRETIPASLETIVLRALARAPADRFATAGEFAQALKAPYPLHAIRPRRRPSRLVTRNLLVAIVLLLVIAIAASPIARRLHGGSTTETVRRKMTTSGDALMGTLSPDGQFLAFVKASPDSQRVVVQDLIGGTLNTVTGHPLAIMGIEWSPDGSHLLVSAGQQAFIVPRLGGDKRLVGPVIDGQVQAYWVGSGTKISAHSSGDRQILVFDAAGDDSVVLKVVGDYTFMNEGSWSPSGKVFALMLEWANPVHYEIRAVGIDGRNQSVVADSIALGSPRWSADGRALYYARGTNELWRVDVSPTTGTPRSKPELVAQDLELYPQRFGLVHFSVSRNDAMIYARGQRYSNLWLVDRNGEDTAAHTIELTTGTALRWSPVFSPDGKWVAFAEQTDAGAELFKVPVNGGLAARITFGAKVRPESQIAWSPTGEQLAFTTLRGGHAQVWVADAGDGHMRRFEQTNASSSTGHLTWAPGEAITFERFDNTNFELLDLNSGTQKELFAKPMFAVHSPVYSPDGSALAFFGSFAGSDGGDYLVHLRDRTVTKFAQGAFYPRGWSADSRYLFLQRPQAPAIFKAEARGNAESPGSNRKPFLRPPFREAQCRPFGGARRNTFVCVAFDFVSDIWRIDNFDRR